MVKIAPEGVALHTEAFEVWAAADEGIKGLRDSAIGLGEVIVDLIADPNLLAQAQAEFEHAGGAGQCCPGPAPTTEKAGSPHRVSGLSGLDGAGLIQELPVGPGTAGSDQVR